MSEKVRELQQGLTEKKVDPFRRQVRKLGINALTALASELGMSLCGIHSMFCTDFAPGAQTWDQCIEGFSF